MNAFRLMGLFAIVPATLLLTVSFFVLFALRKIETQGLKAFGYVIAALLWVSVSLVLTMGIYILSTGRHPMLSAMKGMKCNMHEEMMGKNMPTEMMQHQKK